MWVFRVTLLYQIFLMKPSFIFMFSQQKKVVTGIKYLWYHICAKYSGKQVWENSYDPVSLTRVS